MLTLLPQQLKDCERISRRGALQLGAIGGLASLPLWFAGQQARADSGKPKKDVNCILIWTQGGTSHHDTFDPKPDAPANVRGEFGVIDTCVPGVKFAETLPNLAKNLNRFAVMRSWNPKNGSHGIADQYCLSGQPVNPAVHYPTMGSIVAREQGFKTQMPPFVQLGTALDARFGGGTAGYLGLNHNPFILNSDPNTAPFKVRDITPPPGVDTARVERRRSMLATIDSLQATIEARPDAYDSLDQHVKNALDMITAPATKTAFDIDSEDPRLRDRYGRTKFGQSCLLARRVIESGVRFVTVTDGGWDTHANNFKSLKDSRLPPVDQGLPALLADLEERGMLDNTLVCWLTDFGRTPKINSASGRDHWATAGSIVMAGCGVPGGAVLGSTDDEGGRPLTDEYFSEDIAATIYTKLGIPLDLTTHTPDGRPITLNTGRVVKEWM